MRHFALIAAAILTIVLAACSDKSRPMETVVKGTITVADSLDDSGDFSDIGITIITFNSDSAKNDTIFHQLTDRSGNFEGRVQFHERRFYSLFISRNDNDLVNIGVILSEKDTLTLTAELPDFEQTLALNSTEHEAMETFERVDRGFQRIRAYANAGAISDSQLVDEIKKWSDLYWDVYEKHQNTIAGYLAAEQSAMLLNSWDQEEMLRRIDAALPERYMVSVALDLALPYIAQSKGFDAVSGYLDSLSQVIDDKTISEAILQEKIKIYFDSSRVREAKVLLNEYEQNYAESPSSKKWAHRIRYDLNYLAPGVPAPMFNFITMEGDTINNNILKGEVFILEFSPLANAEYQNDYDRTLIIHEIYKNYGLRIFTIPLDENEITVNAFFEERRKAWSVAKLGSFDVQDLIQKFNVVQVPTRLLIDKEGILIRKYERGEFSEIIQGLNKAFRTSNKPS